MSLGFLFLNAGVGVCLFGKGFILPSTMEVEGFLFWGSPL
jgi:hypothetical protein